MAKEAKNKDVKNKKHFFKDFKAELKKVIWPTPKQIVNNTIAVLTIVIITAIIVFVLDLCFDFINEKGINRFKENVRNKYAVEQNVEENGEEAESLESNIEENAEEVETSEEAQ